MTIAADALPVAGALPLLARALEEHAGRRGLVLVDAPAPAQPATRVFAVDAAEAVLLAARDVEHAGIGAAAVVAASGADCFASVRDRATDALRLAQMGLPVRRGRRALRPTTVRRLRVPARRRGARAVERVRRRALRAAALPLHARRHGGAAVAVRARPRDCHARTARGVARRIRRLARRPGAPARRAAPRRGARAHPRRRRGMARPGRGHCQQY